MYPFKIGTTSFIYSDGYVPNVTMLGPYIDEIELLLFESQPGSLPGQNDIGALSLLSAEFDLTYNIHLPTDISFGHKDPSPRHHAVETILRVLDLSSPLCPSTCTLHLSYDETSGEKEMVQKWRERIYEAINRLVNLGAKAEDISIENINYPFAWVEDMVREFNFTVCMDMGHLMVRGEDLEGFFSDHDNHISIIHLHGVENGCDHLSLTRLAAERAEEIIGILNQFSQTVSLEVFSYHDLATSLVFLEKWWHKLSC
ncbi:MAG: cobamide remodeling phosphodiesterase CbiR [Thermodesulfobacteriota bacterium]|nr:cobamide remodeling phosphodiesterase CbiR [Thermodesulfobacteriota bacterium]